MKTYQCTYEIYGAMHPFVIDVHAKSKREAYEAANRAFRMGRTAYKHWRIVDVATATKRAAARFAKNYAGVIAASAANPAT